MKIYTKTGDDGTTGLIGGTRVSKDSSRIKAYGAVDEANAVIGVILGHDVGEDIRKTLVKIQNDLFLVGSDLSNPVLDDQKNRINKTYVDMIEKEIDTLEQELTPLANFVLPGGTMPSALLHLARTVTRRAESNIVSLMKEEKINQDVLHYINRLSDLFFVMARVINKRNKIADIVWKSPSS